MLAVYVTNPFVYILLQCFSVGAKGRGAVDFSLCRKNKFHLKGTKSI